MQGYFVTIIADIHMDTMLKQVYYIQPCNTTELVVKTYQKHMQCLKDDNKS